MIKRIYHEPFAYPCKIKECVNKEVNGRCSLDFRDVDKEGDCIFYRVKKDVKE